jgi:hypothetical protein
MGVKIFCVLQKKCLWQKKMPNERPTIHRLNTMQIDGTPHRYRGRRIYETVHTRDGVELVSISSRQQWPERPISPWPCVQDSSELLPATAPRAARGRTNARKTAVCMAIGTRGLAPSLLASPGDREDERSSPARLSATITNPPPPPPLPDETTNCP